MKKLMTLTATILMCLSLLIYVPQVKACEVELPECTEETITNTAEPRETPEYADDNV